MLKHVPGSKMGKADGLSRRSDWEKGAEGDNEERTLLKPEWIKQVRVGEVIVEGVDILERIRKSEARDDEVIKVVEEMKRAGVKMLRDEEWREEDGLMLKEGKVYACKSNGTKSLIFIIIGRFVFRRDICLVCFTTSLSSTMLFLLLLRRVPLWLLLLPLRALLLLVIGIFLPRGRTITSRNA